ncbi:GtrA family protein [Sphingomonas panni]
MFGRVVPVRFVMFSAIGAAGAIVHLAALALWLELGVNFIAATIVATVAAMTFNFFLNNLLTYRDRRLRGHGRWSMAGCRSAPSVRSARSPMSAWRRSSTTCAGAWALPALAGIAVGAVWNFALSSRFTWGRYGRKRSA